MLGNQANIQLLAELAILTSRYINIELLTEFRRQLCLTPGTYSAVLARGGTNCIMPEAISLKGTNQR